MHGPGAAGLKWATFVSAGTGDIRAQIALSRLSSIPQDPAEFHGSSEDDAAPAKQPERGPCQQSRGQALDETQHCSEPETPGTPMKDESLPNSSLAQSKGSKQLGAAASEGRGRAGPPGHRFCKKPFVCDLSGNWLPVLAACAIVMVMMTAASLYSSSAALPPLENQQCSVEWGPGHCTPIVL